MNLVEGVNWRTQPSRHALHNQVVQSSNRINPPWNTLRLFHGAGNHLLEVRSWKLAPLRGFQAPLRGVQAPHFVRCSIPDMRI